MYNSNFNTEITNKSQYIKKKPLQTGVALKYRNFKNFYELKLSLF